MGPSRHGALGERTWPDGGSHAIRGCRLFFNNSHAYAKFAGYEGVPLGGVYFCAEHTSSDVQGFMEGGAETGQQTAQDLARVLR